MGHMGYMGYIIDGNSSIQHAQWKVYKILAYTVAQHLTPLFTITLSPRSPPALFHSASPPTDPTPFFQVREKQKNVGPFGALFATRMMGRVKKGVKGTGSVMYTSVASAPKTLTKTAKFVVSPQDWSKFGASMASGSSQSKVRRNVTLGLGSGQGRVRIRSG